MKPHISHCQVCCLRMNCEGLCHTKATRICANWHPWWPEWELVKRVDKLQCKVCSTTLLSRNGLGHSLLGLPKIPAAGRWSGLSEKELPLPFLNTPNPNTERERERTYVHTGISWRHQLSVALPKSDPHSQVCIFNLGPFTQAFQIPVKKWKQGETNRKRSLLLLQCSLPGPFCSGLWVLCLSAGLFLL